MLVVALDPALCVHMLGKTGLTMSQCLVGLISLIGLIGLISIGPAQHCIKLHAEVHVEDAWPALGAVSQMSTAA